MGVGGLPRYESLVRAFNFVVLDGEITLILTLTLASTRLYVSCVVLSAFLKGFWEPSFIYLTINYYVLTCECVLTLTIVMVQATFCSSSVSLAGDGLICHNFKSPFKRK